MSGVPRHSLSAGYDIARVIKGGWQLAGGHGRFDHAQALEDMCAFVQAGVTTFDCADIYTGVEELIGEFLRHYRHEFRSGALPEVQVHTKYVPDLASLPALTERDVERAIERSLRRLGMSSLDLVQFHWWDYDLPGYVEAAVHLKKLQEAGKIRHIGVTNFDVPRLREILEAGVPVVSNQVQYSVLDHRPQRGMVAFCRRHGISLLCYGTIAGGFLSDRYLGAPEPEPPLENRSLIKYQLIIQDFGGWEPFQSLLATLRGVADRHGTSLAAVAMRYVLQKDQVGAVIVGARHARHLPDLLRLFDFDLDQEDLASIRHSAEAGAGPVGDVYAAERIKGGKHAAIMRYNLNEG